MDLFKERLKDSALIFFGFTAIATLIMGFVILVSINESIYKITQFLAFWIGIPYICIVTIILLSKWIKWVFIDSFQEK